MSDQFSVHFLSSGSSGNCTLIRDGCESFLIDFGLGPEKFLSLVQAHGIHLDYWRKRRSSAQTPAQPAAGEVRQVYSSHLSAAVLTHLHGDHFCASALRVLLDNKVVLWVHRNHLPELVEQKSFGAMCDRGLVHTYDTAEFAITARTRVRPVELPHDSTATHGFVFARQTASGRAVRFGYLADLGHVPPQALDVFANCDLLGLEFNHDVQMEKTSGRHPMHIARVLGAHGHLSNEQAAHALRSIIQRSNHVPLRWVAALHISRQCNTLPLARETVTAVLRECGVSAEVLVTRQREYAGFVDLLAPAIDGGEREISLEVSSEAVLAGGKRKVAEFPDGGSVSGAKMQIIVQDLFGYD